MFIIMTSHRWTRVFCFVDLARKKHRDPVEFAWVTYTTNKQFHIISVCLRMAINHRIWGTIFHTHTHTPKREHIFRLSIFSFTCPLRGFMTRCFFHYNSMLLQISSYSRRAPKGFILQCWSLDVVRNSECPERSRATPL